MRMILAFFLLTAASAFAQNDNSYPLLCRGGYLYQIGGWGPGYHVVFRPSRTPAGPTGTTLEPGTCAWMDRPLNTEEPNRITIPFPGSDPYTLGRILDMYQMCALDKKCVIKGRVRAAFDHFEISMIYPDVSIMTDR
jgi:hypothetical protein